MPPSATPPSQRPGSARTVLTAPQQPAPQRPSSNPGTPNVPTTNTTVKRTQVRPGDVQVRELLPSDAVERGLPGTKIWNGLVYEDPSKELQGARGLRKLQQMAYDPTVAALIAVHDRPIRSAAWRVEPVDESPEAIAIADEVWWNLTEFGSQSFDDLIRESHTRMWSGFNYSEICYDIVNGGQYDGHIAWNKIAWRHPLAKWRWDIEEIDTAGGARMRQLVSVTQLAPPNYTYTTIPRDKLLIWTQDLLGENYDGVPLIRFAYKPWFYKDYLLKIQAIGLQRGYMGIPEVTYPENFTNAEVVASQAIVENLRVSENAGVVHPAHLVLDIKRMQLEGTQMQEALNFHDRQILVSCLAQFLALGSQGAAGAYSLSEDQSELFLMQLNAQANYDAEVINLEPGIPRLVAYNYGVQEKYPQLVHGPIGQRDFEKLARGIASLAQQGVLTPDDSLEDALRDQMSLPERDNAVTDDALKDLITEVTGQAIRYQSTSPRAPIPSTVGKGTPEVVGGKDGGPGQTPGSDILELPSSGTPAAARFAEAMARRRWQRPVGRLDDDQRRRIRATEQFAEALETYRPHMGQKMEKPSIYMAKHRRPYVVRYDRPAYKLAESDAQPARKLRVSGNVVTSSTLIAGKHAPKLRGLLATIGPKPKG